jgi:hypothetical protein
MVNGLISRLGLVGGFLLGASASGGEEKAEPTFGKDVQLAPFVVNGKRLSTSWGTGSGRESINLRRTPEASGTIPLKDSVRERRFVY